ncbi:MAG: long-chain-fatty-acid--CoA ligase [Planctomycetota bacterium]
MSQLASSSPDLSTQRPWLSRYPQIVPHTLEYPDLPAWGLLDRTASRHADRIACHYYRQKLTYGELAADARRTASMLVRYGIRPGDRVGILLPNLPEYLSVINGIWMAGGVAVAMSPLMVGEEINAFMKLAGCRCVITLDLLAPLVLSDDYRPEHYFFTSLSDRLPRWKRLGYAFARLQRYGFWPAPDHPSHHALADQVAASDPEFEPLTPDSLEAPAYILPTGGTTGAPKAVTLSHRNLVSNAWQVFHWAGGYEAREKMLTVLPFFHSYGLTTCGMAGVAMAATLIMHHRFIPRVVLRLIEEHQPSIFPAVPAMLAALNDVLADNPVQFKAMRYVISGGAPLPVEIMDEFTRYSGAECVEGYGMSEASPVICTGPLDGTNRPGTIGLPLPDTDVRIVDSETGERELPAGEVGELIVRGPQVMLGYWENSEATAQVIRNGWLFTGDIGVQDEDGFFRIVDRKKDLIITSGFNVYPADVEPVLRAWPDDNLRDVAVIGEPDEHAGELVKAVVSVRSRNDFNVGEFRAYCSEHLAKHKRPKLIEVIEGDLPRNFLGKVLRRKLRASGIGPLTAADAPTVDSTDTPVTAQTTEFPPA